MHYTLHSAKLLSGYIYANHVFGNQLQTVPMPL